MIELGTSRIDVTPPVGCGVGFGLAERTTGVRDPLQLRVHLLRDRREACLIAVADWCGLMGMAYRELQAALAEGAGIPVDRVVIHATHQHDAPLFAFEIETLLGRQTYPRSYWRSILGGARQAASDARGRATAVEEVGFAATPVEEYASARRVLGPDGKLRGNRWSRRADAALVAQPVGTIDPVLRTVAFRAADGGIAATLSFYATHPQVSSGRAVYSADAPGEAMRLIGEETGIPENAFLMGCAGNVNAGKYSSGADLEGNIKRFGERLARAIHANLGSMRWSAAGSLSWKTTAFAFPTQEDKPARLRAEIADSAVPEARKQIAAPVLAAMKDPEGRMYRINHLEVGGTSLVFLPGEPFVEYQLYATGLEPGRPLAMASNCCDSPYYLPLEASFREGGYEVESFCWCTPQIEGLLKGAIRDILAR